MSNTVTAQRLAPIRPGALVRTRRGVRARVARDGSRIHRADGLMENLIRIVPATGPRVPEALLRHLLDKFGPEKAERRWYLTQTPDGAWLMRLDVRAGNRSVASFPQPDPGADSAGEDLPPSIPAACRIADQLWSAADRWSS